jgi:hypothetical protein
LGFEVGPEGIEEGGTIVFQPPAFWGWDPPQSRSSSAPGFTVVDAVPTGVAMTPHDAGQMVAFTVGGRGLKPGEQLLLVYGAGEAMAKGDRFAEHGSELWFGVDGDGDGVRSLIEAPVAIDVLPGPAAGAIATLPSVCAPGAPQQMRVAVVDGLGNGPVAFVGELMLRAPDGLGLPDRVVFTQGDGGVVAVGFTPTATGLFRVEIEQPGGLWSPVNPVVVRAGAQRILWGDLQIHSGRSYGTGTPEEVWRYARDVAGLDVAAVTDHDHWGMRFLDQNPALWAQSIAAASAANIPGQFVALQGLEWTNWVYGHRHIVWFGGRPQMLSSLDPDFDTPPELWAALRGQPALTIAHHSAGGPVAVDWSFAPDPELEPVTEIVSVHGNSEAPNAPVPIYAPVEGNFVIDQLRAGHRLGMLGSTDGHDGHPGLSQLNGPSGGLAAILAPERTAQSIYQALRQRRVYATNGVRMILRFEVANVAMGGVATVGQDPVEAVLRVVGTAPIERVEVVRMDGERLLLAGKGRSVLHHAWPVADIVEGDFVYVRVIQEDGGAGWTSPVWLEK